MFVDFVIFLGGMGILSLPVIGATAIFERRAAIRDARIEEDYAKRIREI